MPAPTVPRPSLGRARPRLARPPSLSWLVALALAAVTGLVVARFVGEAQASAARWGDLRPTLVAVADLEPGAVVGPGDTRIEHRPSALVPLAALGSAADGQTVIAAIAGGEAVVSSRLAPQGMSPTAAALPEDRVGIAVPSGAGALPLEAGDAVDVLATFDPDAAGGGDPTFAVARSALVMGVHDDAVTLAVRQPEAPRVAFALTAGVVTLVLSAGR